MKNLLLPTVIFGVLLALLITIAGHTQAKPTDLPLAEPNTIFNVVRKSGKCPKTVGIWNIYHQDDTIAVYTVIADTLSIGGEIGGFATLVSLKPKLAKFEAPLPKTYISCIGETNSKTAPQYQFEFKEKKVIFLVDLRKVFNTDVLTEKILYARPTISRPYVIWSQSE